MNFKSKIQNVLPLIDKTVSASSKTTIDFNSLQIGVYISTHCENTPATENCIHLHESNFICIHNQKHSRKLFFFTLQFEEHFYWLIPICK